MSAPTISGPVPQRASTDGRRTGPPPAAPPRRPDGPPPRRVRVSDDALTAALALVCLAAVLGFRNIFIGSDWVRPVAGAVVLATGIGWGARRLDAGPLTHLAMTVVSLLVFITIAFLPTTAVAGLVPTPGTAGALRDLFLRGLELVELRPSPTFAEPGLLLLAVGGAWIVTYLADGMLFVLRSATKAVTCALVLWAVPLAIAPTSGAITVPAATMLGTSALLLLLGASRSAAAWGQAVDAPGRDGRPRTAPLVPWPGWVLAAAATVLGLVFASVLPGYGADPLYETGGGSGTTITTNPIVDIRQRLVATDTGPVLQVDSPRPVYLRTTALDRYGADEQWTAGTISGRRPSGAVIDSPPEVQTERVDVAVTIDQSIESGAVLAPAPFQPIEVAGAKAEVLRYDDRSSTLTVPGDEPLVPGDTYEVAAAVPQPTPDALRTVGLPGAGTDGTELPDDVPDEVVALARQIVNDAGAATMFDAALAIQDELRTWSYSTQPEPGTGSTAMLRFIDAREGYCEQFAGTMAVMLRTLGIPARLAVGYTPGTPQGDESWQVTNANAHAWVEVDFGQMGWIAFEPTPRSDGNVLVTSETAVTPDQTLAQQDASAVGPSEDPLGPGDLNDLANLVPPTRPDDAPLPDEASGAAGGSDGGTSPVWAVLLGLLAVAGVGALVAVRARRSGPADAPPQVRIDAARRRVELVGRAVGRSRHPAETDDEYFARIARGHRAGTALARPATRAVYAPAVTAAEADEAESAARVLVSRLTDDQPAWRRGLVAVRMAIGR